MPIADEPGGLAVKSQYRLLDLRDRREIPYLFDQFADIVQLGSFEFWEQSVPELTSFFPEIFPVGTSGYACSDLRQVLLLYFNRQNISRDLFSEFNDPLIIAGTSRMWLFCDLSHQPVHHIWIPDRTAGPEKIPERYECVMKVKFSVGVMQEPEERFDLLDLHADLVEDLLVIRRVESKKKVLQPL